MHHINKIVSMLKKIFEIFRLCLFVYFDVLSDDGFPIEQKRFVRATVGGRRGQQKMILYDEGARGVSP